MSHCHVAVQMASRTAETADAVVNTFNFVTAGSAPPTGTEVNDYFTLLVAFYNEGIDLGASISSRFTRAISRATNSGVMKFYDASPALGGGSIGSPFQQAVFTLDPLNSPAEEPLPNEVSIAVSYHAAFVGGEFGPGNTRPRSRKRGRIFLPAFGITAVSHDTNDQPIVAGLIQTNLSAIAERLMEDSGGRWAVWSRANASMDPVIGGYVDAEFDTIRSRGKQLGAASKVNFGV